MANFSTPAGEFESRDAAHTTMVILMRQVAVLAEVAALSDLGQVENEDVYLELMAELAEKAASIGMELSATAPAEPPLRAAS